MRRVAFFMVLTVGGCRCGTVSVEELEASYEVMPDEHPSVLARELAEGIDGPFRIVELLIYADRASAEIVHTSHPDRVIDMTYDGWTVNEGSFSALDADLDAATVGFTMDELPIDRLGELVARTREVIDRPVATFSHIRIDREDDEPLRIEVFFRSFREGTAYVRFDAQGTLLETHQ